MRCPSKTTYWDAIGLGVLVLVPMGVMLSATIFKEVVPFLVSLKSHAALTPILSDAALFMTLSIMVLSWAAKSFTRVDRRPHPAELTRDLYRHMFVHSKDSIVVIDLCGYYVEQNLQHEQLLGYTPQELIGQTPALTLGANDFVRMRDELSRTGMYRSEALCRTKSGRRVCVDLSAFSVKDEEGHVVGHVCITRDMTDQKRAEQIQHEAHHELERRVLERTSALMKTNEALKVEAAERRQAEEALRESEGRFRVIFNHASVGIAEVQSDGRFLRANAKLCEILGRQEDVLLKMTFQELTHPDDLPENLARLQETLEGRRESCSIEKRYLRSDGMDVWCRLSVSLVRTAGGTPRHFISVAEDISERKRTTEALRSIVAATASVTDEDFFSSFVAHLPPAMGVRYAFVGELLDGKAGFVRTLVIWAGNTYGENKLYEVHGMPCAHVLAQCQPYFHPQGVHRRFRIDSVFAGMQIESYYGVPLRDREGRVLGVLAVMHDQPLSLFPGMEQMLAVFAARAGIELERKRTLEALRFSDLALRQLIEEREQLAQDLHDGIIQSIYAAALGLEEARRLVPENATAAVGQMTTVVGDLNSLIVDVRNHIVRKPREIKNGQQLKLALERLVRVSHMSTAMQIVAAVDRAAADRLLPGEATHVYYIAAEALSNAVRHAGAGHCLLALRLVSGAVRLEVSDNGSGFDPSGVHREGHGLSNLSSRAVKLGTTLRISTSPGTGARLIIDVPKEPRDD
ncbi:MAG TPA: PAS domain S-box protein [Nitrospiraceae bacterium]|nr:PAS domain S-box protein [Nitrospiraceae bacterium]